MNNDNVTDSVTLEYIAGWSSGMETSELKQSLGTIQNTASKLISNIENKIPEIRKDIQLKENVTNYVIGDDDKPEIEQTAGMRM